ncbi:ABC transporter substrate-binding protein [Acidocella sp.]|uniref:ABC transporter substrate-binding protein n=1 Tax=Acidocella sp. TaxID=50710 RepID=UPI003CFE7FAF
MKILATAMVATMLAGVSVPALAESSTLTLARLPGLPHLPMIIMQQQHLVEKQLAAEGLSDTKVKWMVMAGSAQTDALISGNVNITSFGVTNLASVWAATGGRVKAIAAEDSVINYLVTTDPKVKSIKDLTAADKIAVPSILVSPQAIMLKMAAEKAYGDSKKLDALTVAMEPADATLALLSGSGTVNTHFSVPPYQEIEMADPKVHVVTSSYDIMGSKPSTVVVLGATKSFYDANPKIIHAVLSALTEADDFIKAHPEEAAKLYLEDAHDTKTKPALIVSILKDPKMIYTRTPQNIMSFVGFMYKIGQINRKPDSWKDLFFPVGQLADGS